MSRAAAVAAFPAAPTDVPPFVQEWLRQLLDDETLELLRLAGDRQVDVHLSATRGRVRRRPVVQFNAGPQEMVPVTEDNAERNA